MHKHTNNTNKRKTRNSKKELIGAHLRTPRLRNPLKIRPLHPLWRTGFDPTTPRQWLLMICMCPDPHAHHWEAALEPIIVVSIFFKFQAQLVPRPTSRLFLHPPPCGFPKTSYHRPWLPPALPKLPCPLKACRVSTLKPVAQPVTTLAPWPWSHALLQARNL